jgi:hypothetical protein
VQCCGRSGREQRHLCWLLDASQGDETIAPSRDGDDVAPTVLAVAEGAAQSTHLDLQIGFLNEGSRPGAGDQLFLANHFAGAFDQGRQDLEGAAAQPHRLIPLEQQSLRCQEPERPKRNRVCVHVRSEVPKLCLMTCDFTVAARRTPNRCPSPHGRRRLWPVRPTSGTGRQWCRDLVRPR